MDMSLSRRKAMQALAVSAPLAAVLADPKRTRAAAEGLQGVSLTTRDGRNVSASLALPDETPAPTILLIHEWWGLNDQIKTVAAELAKLGYVALAVDLYDQPPVTDPDDARALMQATKAEEATDTLVSWIDWLKQHEASTGKVATIGWCFGGGWSLNASLATPVDATVIYYGRVNKTAAELETLQGAVLGHFATRDSFIDKPMVDGFEAAMNTAGKPLALYWYEADHAFANPTSGRYDEDDAALAWERTLEFFKETL
jgi:carboxymethylenebutenolidase